LQGAAALEAAKKVKIVVFDKTGTLTQGAPAVVHQQVFAGLPADEILLLAAAAEISSEHPLARAIMAHADAFRTTGACAFDIESPADWSHVDIRVDHSSDSKHLFLKPSVCLCDHGCATATRHEHSQYIQVIDK
jgi:cation transport ATPase